MTTCPENMTNCLIRICFIMLALSGMLPCHPATAAEQCFYAIECSRGSGTIKSFDPAAGELTVRLDTVPSDVVVKRAVSLETGTWYLAASVRTDSLEIVLPAKSPYSGDEDFSWTEVPGYPSYISSAPEIWLTATKAQREEKLGADLAMEIMKEQLPSAVQQPPWVFPLTIISHVLRSMSQVSSPLLYNSKGQVPDGAELVWEDRLLAAMVVCRPYRSQDGKVQDYATGFELQRAGFLLWEHEADYVLLDEPSAASRLMEYCLLLNTPLDLRAGDWRILTIEKPTQFGVRQYGGETTFKILSRIIVEPNPPEAAIANKYDGYCNIWKEISAPTAKSGWRFVGWQDRGSTSQTRTEKFREYPVIFTAIYERTDGWVQWRTEDGGNGHWYKLVNVTPGLTWFAASDAATAQGAYLATITSAAENAFIWQSVLLGGHGFSNKYGPWIGGYQEANASEPNGGWRWVTGETWLYTNWDSGEPNDGLIHGAHYEQHLNFFNTWNDFPGNALIGGYIMEVDQ